VPVTIFLAKMRRHMSTFLRMRKSELYLLVALIGFSAASFLPLWRDVTIAGMSLFGWWMAALMILAPAAALAVFFYERKQGNS
jgi:membrane protein YqaA with SNARE-associated domain